MSRLTLISSIILAFGLAGCARNQNQETAFEIAGQAKALVAIVPVIDNAKSEQYDWNLSEEFTASISSHLERCAFALEDPVKVRAIVKRLSDSHNPFGSNTAWIKEAFRSEQYVVFLELVKHEETLKQEHKKHSDPKMCPADLNMSMRIRVFDLSLDRPKIILQEIVNDSHYIPRQFTKINFYQVPWGDESFSFSPLGLAHMQFVKEISLRIEDYILLNEKSQH